jgi:diaminohydroxyphosphoribosylaminopyrimidine deaminase / 5-amino-6-(5-phosphoribosylamino)uracil reductase
VPSGKARETISSSPGPGLPRGMLAALGAARRGQGRVSPNPLVGAALVFPDGRLVAAGHLRFGGPHAEARLLDHAAASGDLPGGRLPAGATLYVTLEPCAHQGKTPPCLDRILAARPRKVVIATLDPDPRTCGRGVRGLRRAGIEVDLGPGQGEALSLNLGFHLAETRGRSVFRLKLASSLDARLSADSGESRWITGGEARVSGHRERAHADAVLAGSGTVLKDDPELNVRHLRGPQPSRIVLDSCLRTPPRCRLWRAWRSEAEEAGAIPPDRILGQEGNYLQVGSSHGLKYLRRPRLILATRAGWTEAKLARYRAAGWEVWELPADRGGKGKVSLPALARRTAREGLQRVLVEAGPALAGAFFEADLADEISLYLAPLVLGGSRAWPGGYVAPTLKGARRFLPLSEERMGADRRLFFRREGLLEKARILCSPA